MTTRIKDLPNSERPRERLVAHGPDSLSTAELIAILLRTGTKGASAVDIARQLVAKHGNLNALSSAPLKELSVKGIGRDKAVALKAAFTLARRLVAEVAADSPVMDNPELVANLLREQNREYQVEHLQLVLLNTRRRLMRVHTVSQGTLDATLAHPREVFRPAIEAGASAVILVHNHPSGDPTPSEADIQTTRDMIRAGQLLRIEVLDHIILGKRTESRPQDYVSLRQLGYCYT